MLDPNDFHWEKRFIETLEEMERLADAQRPLPRINKGVFENRLKEIGNRGVATVSLLHPLGFLVRNAHMENVFSWFMIEKDIMHRFCGNSNNQVKDTVVKLHDAGIGPYFKVTAHEMLIPPWMGMNLFNEYVFPYDKTVNDAVHAAGGKIRAHCHGNCMQFLERMSDMGLDAIEPLEPPPYGDVDLKEAKHTVGDRMMLCGNIVSQEFVTLERDDVHRLVQEAFRDAAQGGGFSLRCTGGYAGTGSAADKEQTLKMLDNIRAYIEAGIEYGNYPIAV